MNVPNAVCDGVETFKFVVSEPTNEIGAAQLLRQFDLARRRLSQQFAQTEGVGAGYDDVHICWAAIRQVSAGDTATITASITSERGLRHLVEYRAAYEPTGGGHYDASSINVELATARGWTLTTSARGVSRSQPVLAGADA